MKKTEGPSVQNEQSKTLAKLLERENIEVAPDTNKGFYNVEI